MKDKKLVAHIAEHKPTGAMVPMIVKKTDENNKILDYKEHLLNRKGFTLDMLQHRWDLCQSDTIELLQKYQVPAHVNHQDVLRLPKNVSPLHAAIFFEEYIYGLEKKEGLKHSKLKPRTLEALRTH